jgi:asparagine synthase (glutamine-hydrolysing)
MGLVFDDDFRRRNCPALPGHPSALEGLSQYFAGHSDWHGMNLHFGGLIETWLPDELLHKADRMTMAHSLELRCPFLDANFAAYCATLSLDAKAIGREGEPFRKRALKRAFHSRFPAGIAYQNKKGFPIPVYNWLATRLAGRAAKELGRRDALGASLFPSQTLDGIMRQAVAGDLISQRRVWSIITLNKWADRWL